MNGLYKEDGKHFFAASNTKDGFVSYFDEIFGENECDKVYILKGGPGCGKSTFMKKLGKKAEEKGFSCEYFHCSSDPDSLDGVIIKEKKVAVIDGTKPHAVEPSLSGVREIIINLGLGWDTDKLYENKDEIIRLADLKKKHFADCYNYLYSKDVFDGLLYNLTFSHILFDKLDKSVSRLAKSIFRHSDKNCAANTKTRITEALSSLGKIRLFTFEDMAETCIFLKDPFPGCRLSHLFMKGIHDLAKRSEKEMLVSFKSDKKGEINALYFPDSKISLSLFEETAVDKCDKSFKKCKIINCSRFVDIKALSHTKPLRRFYTKISDNLEGQALHSLSCAGKIHADIEKIYRQCTDYTTVENITNEYINKILNN